MIPLPPELLYLPFGPGPYRMAMALTACSPQDLIEIDDRYPDEMAERRHLLATRRADVLAAIPGAGPACQAVLTMIAGLLTRHHPAWFERREDMVLNHLTGEEWNMADPEADKLEVAARLVQEDLCVIDVSAGEPRLTAAVLCAPTRWVLLEKIGQPLRAVHGPVPSYAERLAVPVDRFMAALKPGKGAVRVNWSVVDDGALFQQRGKHRIAVNPAITAANAPDTLFLRCERQTFARLPGVDAVLFAIRVHSYPLSRVLRHPGAAADLAAALRALPDDMAAYKSLPSIKAAALDCLDAHAGAIG